MVVIIVFIGMVVIIVFIGMVVIMLIGVVVIVMHGRAERAHLDTSRRHHDVGHLARAFYRLQQGLFISSADDEHQIRPGNGYEIARRRNECMRISSQWHQGMDISFVPSDLARDVRQDALRGHHLQHGPLRPGRDRYR